MNPILVITTK